MKEIWKPVRNYEGLYEVSNMGRVKSLNYRKTGKERILKVGYDECGYPLVALCKEGKMKTHRVHRLVGQAFCENLMGYTELNHIDEDKQNNRADNLEWCSRQYNVTYNGRAKKAGKKTAEKLSKPVYSINKESGLITYWESAKVASRQTGIASSNICACLKGRQKSCGNHIWFYADDDDTE